MSTVLSFISDFLLGFRLWLQNSTPLELIGILIIPITVDYLRSVGKSIFLIFHTMYLRTTRHARGATGATPSVSLIIPAHNEERTIVRAIESALETNYQNKEIIVVDDGSKDKTRDKALPYANKGLIKLIIRDVASGSKAGAVNHGLFYAKNDIVIVVDADTLIERNSIKKLVKYFADPSVTAVSGNVRILRGDSGKNNLLVKLQAYEYIMSLEMGRRYGAITKSILIIPGAFGALKRKLALSVGGYDKDTITEDFDLTIKMRKLKGRILFAGEAVSWTFAPDTWKAWRRQRVRWTRGQIETFNKHKNIFLKQRFSLSLVMAFFDMFFMDLSLLLIKTIWMVLVPFIYTEVLGYVLLLASILYILSEGFTFLTASLLSPRKGDFRKIYLVPIIVFFYRPYYALIRLKGYFDWIQKREARW